MVLNAAVQMLREADELKLKILKFKSGTSMLQERSLWATQQQLQKVYQKVLVLDLDYALDKKVEQDLWNVGFKQQIEALQAIAKDRKNPLRSEGQAMLSWVLQAAGGFYLCLLHQICTTFKLDLPFRRRASLLGCVEGWGAGGGAARLPAPHAARYICQHCLVHLGDLARYRQQLRVAHTFYRHAVVVSAHCGQPYNQLALVSWRRGRRLGALYWHVRSLCVRAPFPPAADNLARTLSAAANLARQDRSMCLPVLAGVTSPESAPPAPAPAPLDAHQYVSELIRAMHLIHTVEQLDTAEAIVESLNSSLTALVATDNFESMTLIKMCVVLIWLCESSSEGAPALTGAESRAAELAAALAAGALLALLLPHDNHKHTLPPLKVWLSWLSVGGSCVAQSAAWRARPHLWHALAHALNGLPADTTAELQHYETVPLPEDEELHGFLPLEAALQGLKFANHAAWDTYGASLPQVQPENEWSGPVGVWGAGGDTAARVRALRLRRAAAALARAHAHCLACSVEEGVYTFTAACACAGPQLAAWLAAARAAAARPARAPRLLPDSDDDDEPPPTRAPLVISEADFREKVREKRVGILKPQGSLERAREERALASTQDDVDDNDDEGKGEDKKELRKPRVNIAMAAIMRKQEETNKQVKFVTPPPTPEGTPEADTREQDKPKIIQPKAIKSLANLPIGRKTGGILSLKDKSGYPHLVNTDPEPKKEKDDKKDSKPTPSSQNPLNYQTKRQDAPNWGNNIHNAYNEPPRMGFPKSYTMQNQNISFNPNYPPPNVGQGIRLPVVNPKEIDVRTAALQKQNSRQEMFHDGQKYNHNYQISGDKKNFLNDLPPRFANQYRYSQNPQDNQFDNKFRDENFKPNNSLFNAQSRANWNTPLPDNYQQPSWWKPENPPPNFSPSYPQLNMQTNFFPQMPASMTPYQNMTSFNQMPNQGIGQNKDNLITPPNYLQSTIGQPQMQTLQNLVSSPNFNSTLNSFGNYAPPVGYDSSMYPQFSNKVGYQPLQMKMLDKNQVGYQGNKDLMDMSGLNFGSNVLEMQQRNVNMGFSDAINNDNGGAINLDQGQANAEGGAEAGVSTYSLFSGAPESAAWGAAHYHHQSLWSGPGPSPLERLLEQQKQLKPPAAPQ